MMAMINKNEQKQQTNKLTIELSDNEIIRCEIEIHLNISKMKYGIENTNKKCYKIIRTKFTINKGLREKENYKKKRTLLKS